MPAKKKTAEKCGEKANFTFDLLDDEYLPVIFRDGKKFLSVRIVELKLLTRFPLVLPDELRALQKCVSYFITEKEAAVLDEINLDFCKGEYGFERYTTNDVVVEWHEFRKFFELVSDTIICKTAIDMGFTDGGWLQVNNTVCPYVWVGNVRHLPYEVVFLAAELLDEDDEIAKVKVTEVQLKYLNRLCRKTNRTFSFDESTELVSLLALKLDADPVIIELPPDKPFEHATYVDVTLNYRGIAQIKARAKEAMNAFYNASIIKRYQKGEGEDSDSADSGSSPSKSPPDEADKLSPTPLQAALGAQCTDHDFTSLQNRPQSAMKPPRLNSSPLSSSSVTEIDIPNTPKAKPSKKYAVTSTTLGPATEPSKAFVKGNHSQPQSALTAQSVQNIQSTKANNFPAQLVSSGVWNPPSIPPPPAYSTLPPDLMESRTVRSLTMAERYFISSHLAMDKRSYYGVDDNLKRRIIKAEPMLEGFTKGMILGSVIHWTAVQMVIRCVHISSKTRFIFQMALEKLKQKAGYQCKKDEEFYVEATSVVTDAITNFEFWNASAHKVSIGAAERINNALRKSISSNDPFSVNRNPDIVHYICGGVFGARTLPGAANFRLLQEIMSVALISTGGGNIPPFTAYNVAEQKLPSLHMYLFEWCRLVSHIPVKLSEEGFAARTYHLFDQIYGKDTSERFDPRSPAPSSHSGLQASPPVTTLNQHKMRQVPSNLTTGHHQVSMNLPTLQPAPPTTYQNTLPQHFIQSRQVHFNQHLTKAPYHSGSMLPTVVQYAGLPPAASSHQILPAPCGTLLSTGSHVSNNHMQPAPHGAVLPTGSHQSYLNQRLNGSGQTQSPSIAALVAGTFVAQPTKCTTPFSTTGATQVSTANTIVTSTMSAVRTNIIANSTAVTANFPTGNTSSISSAITAPVSAAYATAAVRGPNTITTSATNTASISTGSTAAVSFASAVGSSVDYAELISLVRAHGKKITTYSDNGKKWVLVEDVQKTYFPRMLMKEFLERSNAEHNDYMLPLSEEVSHAFKHHYEMTDSEQFEIDLMMQFDSISVVISELSSTASGLTASIKRPAEDSEGASSKKPAP